MLSKLVGRQCGWFKVGHPDLVPAEARKRAGLKLSATLVRIGHKPPSNKGKHWKLSEESRRNISLGHRGSKSSLWKGGISDSSERRSFMRTFDYKLWREKVFKRDNYTCQICNLHGVKLVADHILSFAAYPELCLDVSNGRTLCIPCHKKTDNYGSKAAIEKTELELDEMYHRYWDTLLIMGIMA